MSDPTQKEVSDLVSDVMEQVLYLQELGVETLDVDLPEFSLKVSKKVRSKKSEIGLFPAGETVKSKIKEKGNREKSCAGRTDRKPQRFLKRDPNFKCILARSYRKQRRAPLKTS